jgi:hypothetical protein
MGVGMSRENSYAPLDSDGQVPLDRLGNAPGGSGAPDDATYLVGASHADLSAEIVVGATPGGELGGTWASPTVDATHSGSTHGAAVTTHEAAGDPHTGYRLESADHSHATTGLQGGTIAHSVTTGQGINDHHNRDHAAAHASGGADAVKLDDLAAPDDNTDLNATTGQHGLLPKLGGGSTNYLRADGTWAAPSGSGAPASVDYLVGTADGGLSSEIVVGTSPGGELGGTWASPTVDATHASSQHPVGFQAFAFPVSFVHTAAFTTALALAANGGSLAVPITVDGPMLLRRVAVRNTDAATARAWRWDLYADTGANSLTRVAASNGSESFTAAAASTRTLAAASAPVTIWAGHYWLVIQSTHATSTFGVGTTAVSAAFPIFSSQTKTTTNPNGASLDFVAVTWTKATAMVAVALQGDVFGTAAVF